MGGIGEERGVSYVLYLQPLLVLLIVPAISPLSFSSVGVVFSDLSATDNSNNRTHVVSKKY